MRNSILNKILRQVFLQVSLIGFALSLSNAQQASRKRGVEVEFVNKRTEHSSHDISSNVLRIRNNSATAIAFDLHLTSPDGWSNVSRRSTKYVISPNDSLFIPVNLAPKKINTGNISHIINASLVAENQMQFASAIWYMNIKKESKWAASLTYNKIFFLDESDTAHFSIRLQNMGNAPEEIKVNFNADKRLKVLDNINNHTQIFFYNVKLPVNTDTLIYFKVEKQKPVQQAFREDFEAVQLAKNDYYPLRISVQNQPGDKSLARTWRGTVDFIKAGTEARLHEYHSLSLPLTIEANVDNFLDNSTMLNLGLYGNANLEKNRSLTYRYQTFFINNFYTYTPYLGNSHYVGYFTPRTNVEIGDVNGNSNLGFTPTGRGIKGTYQLTEKHNVGAFYLRGPGFFNQYNKSDYGLSYEFRKGATHVENFIQFNENSLLNTKGTQYSNKVRFMVSRNQSVIINSALSNEVYNDGTTPLKRNGFAYAVNYNGTFNKLSLNLSNSFGSEYNIGYRGIKSVGADVLYRLGRSSALSAGAFIFDQKPQYFSSTGLLLNSRESTTERYELKYNINKAEYNVALRAQHMYTEIFNLRSESNGLGFDFRPKATNDMRFFVSVAGAYNKLLDYDIDPYFTTQVRSSFRYKGLTTNLRYYYGPYQTYEQLLFATSKINNQSIFVNTNMRFWLIKRALTLEPSMIYSYETLYRRNRISLRPELYYVPKRGLEVKFYGQYMNNNQRNNPFLNQNNFTNNFNDINRPIVMSNLFFGVGIKKRIGVPVSARKYHKLSVAVFKDLNGNGKQDRDEQGLKNVLVNIKPLVKDTALTNYSGLRDNGEHFITNEQGKVTYNNLPKGSYIVKIVPLSESDGFFAGSEQVVKIDGNQDLMMPLNQGVQLTGVLVAERDPTAADFDKKVDLSKIRVSALDSLGKTFTALTDKDGRFSIRLPAGVYQVSINENALPDNFELEQKLTTIEMITVSDIYNLTFFIKERKRKINIKRFDSNGNVIENN
ncbi:SdrD B-like domain-containing protein [Paradesertivirga mongoliensis]|uniref:SdrD B-like domain-containing protein n=1 Tax=Paradesertivirga mongoliensis TaxID=2100740 RepID=A0ABW4ZLJ7_9SPHI|nr:SdrD B-like domain-containing protein [Pedobacter mongoliensis]